MFGFVTSVLTARWLGPEGKGTLSALSFLGDVLFLYVCLMGMGEAAIVLIGRKGVALQRAVSASLVPLLLSGSIGVAALFVAAVPAEWSGILGAVALQAAILVLALYMNLFHDVLNSRERFGLTSALATARVAVTASLTAVLLAFTPLEIEGAVAAALCGVAVEVIGQVFALRRMGISIRPVWDRAYLVRAAKLGIAIQAAYLLMAMSQRVDQLLVYSLVGPVEGGLYAVALTLGLLPGFVPGALSQASFPRLAYTQDSELWSLTAQIVRVGLIGGVVTASVLATAVPFLTPIIFGESYAASITPALILMVGSVIWSVQWILARAWAARGRPTLLISSFLASVLLMLLLDIALIPVYEMAGAAVASVAGSLAGLSVCLVAYHRRRTGFVFVELIPGRQDLRLLAEHARGVFRG
ncbi:MAG: polysaccharide biosynthesis C-terminal domain-containing protein [Actinomycetota bacterium]